MKIFSSLLAFAMVFACLSVACADLAPPPRPHTENDFIDVYIANNGTLLLEFEFPYDCSCKYRLVDKSTGDTILSDKGKYSAGEVVETNVNVKERLSADENFFLLTLEMSDIKAQTRFGTKTGRNKRVVSKTIVVTKNLYGKRYSLSVYDSEGD